MCIVLLLYDLGSGEDFVACVVAQGKVDDILAAHGAVGVCRTLLADDRAPEGAVRTRTSPPSDLQDTGCVVPVFVEGC